jgi:NAD(P)H-dependent FMN reductase
MRNKDTQPVSIVGISGSLRKAFFSTEILRVLAEESKPPIHFHLVTLEEIPVYNEGLKTATRVPAVNALFHAEVLESTQASGFLPLALPWQWMSPAF